ncbi:MAG: ABC transporter substrate-binding protein, partial [Gemmatimonadaceae bacterium]|nr:ABC transporter substrate-binding protein [Gemmatimonadaceae bacterium]
MIARCTARAKRHVAGRAPGVRGGAMLGRRTARLLAACALVACAGSPRDPGTLVIASGTDLEGMQPLTTVHPLSRQVQRHLVFTPLVALDSSLQVAPHAAERWTWREAGRTLVLTIDTTLRWHDGARLTAHDAAFTLALARDAATGWSRRGELASITSAAAIDDATLALTFERAPGAVPLVLTELPLLPRHVLGAVPPASLRAHPFTDAPVGSGPYRVVRREAGRRWILERMPRYPARLGGPAASPVVVIAVVDEATTKVAGLVSGALDLAGVNPATAALVARDPTLRLVTYPTLFTNWLVFTASRPPFDDVRVRRAVALAIDRRRLVDGGVGGFATPSRAWSADLARDTT